MTTTYAAAQHLLSAVTAVYEAALSDALTTNDPRELPTAKQAHALAWFYARPADAPYYVAYADIPLGYEDLNTLTGAGWLVCFRGEGYDYRYTLSLDAKDRRAAVLAALEHAEAQLARQLPALIAEAFDVQIMPDLY